jgi:hypothetical protein
MKGYNYILTLILILVNGACWAYGSSSSSSACAKPKFSDFVPAENTEVASGSNFSFTASANTISSSIKVTVKDQPVKIDVTTKKTGNFEVNGTLPASLKGVFARIAIDAVAQNNCKGGGGWLVKITE